jgi:hypothetical protein
MRRLIAIVLVLLGVFAFQQLDMPTAQAATPGEIADARHEELSIDYRNNRDAESPTQLVVPSVQIRTVNGPRTNTYRAPQIAATGHHYTTSNYVVARFVNRLSHYARAVDFYLYTFCQLRL